ncbi:hypothetical protein [Rubrimonas cliftonensis]|uniref:Uncharacterized protein n=1 Tax=Rubrimonas cliftonensis TaxID=89524 RepID=A0A1H4EJJ3_9RHOB|nr:hypothetical protein [Rubrimonas cliftonensis]SEA85116.1 hypothetical protein SAMN05444370_11450 [Rubrimonas cliftonensis]
MDTAAIFEGAARLEQRLRDDACPDDADRLRDVLAGDPPSLPALRRALRAIAAHAETHGHDEPDVRAMLAEIAAAPAGGSRLTLRAATLAYDLRTRGEDADARRIETALRPARPNQRRLRRALAAAGRTGFGYPGAEPEAVALVAEIDSRMEARRPSFGWPWLAGATAVAVLALALA